MLSDVKPTPKPSLGVRQQRKQQTREALLAAAKTVVKRRGFAKTTTREVAEEAGVAVGTVFVHFPDVGTLAEALLDEHIAAALETAFRTLPRRADLVRRLVHVSKKLFESYDVDPELSREYLAASLFRSAPEGPGAARRAQYASWVGAQIAEAVSSGAMPAIDPRLAFSTFFALYFSVLVAGLRGELSRKEQLAFLDASLRKLFRMEVHT